MNPIFLEHEPTLEPKIKRLDGVNGVFAVGDIHGMYSLLDPLIDEIKAMLAEPEYAGWIVVFLGDLIDRGPENRKCLNRVREECETNKNWYCLRGNHEEFFVEFDGFNLGDIWLHPGNGGNKTLAEYDGDTKSYEADRIWLKSLPLAIETDSYFLTHAGIQPGVPLADQDAQDLQWIRWEFITSPHDHPKYVIHGHTPIRDGRVERRHNRCNMDTGSYYTKVLTVGVFPEDRSKEPIFVAAYTPDDGGDTRIKTYHRHIMEYGKA